MTAPGPIPTPAPGRFTVAHAGADHWGSAAKACLEGIAGGVAGANMGILYAAEALGDDLPSILTFLRETTRIPHWIGAAAPGLCAGTTEYRGGGALAVMVGHLPAGAFRCFSGLDGAALKQAVAWPGGKAGAALIHGDPRNPAMAAMVAELADCVPNLAGGLVSAAGPPAQIADSVVSGGLSGLALAPDIPVVLGVTQGCAPIGAVHMVTEAFQGVLMTLDGRPALEVLKDDAGELIARRLDRAAGYIHIALPVTGGDGHDYLVRTLVGIDPRQGWLAVGERLVVGQKLMFVRRDANGARADLKRMVKGARAALAGRRPLAALYVSCVGRGVHMFGEEGREMALVQEALGDVPMIGYFANGEIAGGRLYGYTGVLAIIAAPLP